MTEMLISNVTHEYLTPIRCIYNLSTILYDNTDAELSKHAKMIQNTSQLLLSQINTTLDGNLIEQNKFQAVNTVNNIKSLVRETVAILQS